MSVPCRPGISLGDICEWTYPERVSCVDFVRKHGYVPDGPRQGKITFYNRPYQEEVYAAVDDDAVRIITLVWCVQSGKTTTELNVMQWHTCTRPTALMMALPSKNSRNDFVEDKLRPAVRNSPKWRSELLTGKPNEDIVQHKARFRNSVLYIALMESEADLAQRTCEVTMADESDKARTSKTDGDQFTQLGSRSTTFEDPLQFRSSTPTTKDGNIWGSWKKSDQSRRYFACPKCGERQIWDIRNLRTVERPIDKSTGRKRTLEAHAELIEAGAIPVWYEPECRCPIKIAGTEQKNELNRNAVWIPGRPEIKTHRGFRVTCFDVPDHSFETILADYFKAKHEEERGSESAMRNFMTHLYAHPYSPRRKSVGVEAIIDHAVSPAPRGVIPRHAEYTTLAIDVQHDRIYWMRTAFRQEGPTAWIVDWGFIDGEFETLATISKEPQALKEQPLDHLLLTPVPKIAGNATLDRVVFIDAGDGNMSAPIYRYCPRFRDGRVRPIKGDLTDDDHYWRHVGQKNARRQPHRGLLLHLNSSLLKLLWTKWLERPPNDETCLQFPRELKVPGHEDKDFQFQMVSEEPVTQGKRTVFRQKGANHYFDTMTYTVGAAVAFCGLLQNASPKAPAKSSLSKSADPNTPTKGNWVKRGARQQRKGWMKR